MLREAGSDPPEQWVIQDGRPRAFSAPCAQEPSTEDAAKWNSGTAMDQLCDLGHVL